MKYLKILFKNILENPRTTSAGIFLICNGLKDLSCKQLEIGIGNICLGLSFCLMPDSKKSLNEKAKENATSN